MNLNFSDTESLSSLSTKSAEGPIDDLDKDLFGGLGQTPKKNLQRKSVSFGKSENEQVKTTDSKPATGSILKSNLKPPPTNNKSLDDFLDDFSDKDDPLDGLLSSESEANPIPPASGTKKNTSQPEKIR